MNLLFKYYLTYPRIIKKIELFSIKLLQKTKSPGLYVYSLIFEAISNKNLSEKLSASNLYLLST